MKSRLAAIVLMGIVMMGLFVPQAAQAQGTPFNAFAPVVGTPAKVDAPDGRGAVAVTLSGPVFLIANDSPRQIGSISCELQARPGKGEDSDMVSAFGSCTLTRHDGATGEGVFQCTGFDGLDCRGNFRVTSGTGELSTAQLEATVEWRPILSRHELRTQADATTAWRSGILIWRGIRTR